jgi:GNAT superfamily N-acetyltransferase
VGRESAHFARLGLSLSKVEPSGNADIAIRISCLLTAVSTELMESKGGHIPDEVVRRSVHAIYTSRRSVENTFSQVGHRFIVCTADGDLVSTALISRAPDVVLGFCGQEPVHASVEGVHPEGFHSIFNLAVATAWRRQGIARAMLTEIAERYRSLFHGRGWWVRSEPPDHNFYVKLGFIHDTAHDGFVEGIPSPSILFPDTPSFNEAYWCRCPRYQSTEPTRTSKLRYWAFLQNWP